MSKILTLRSEDLIKVYKKRTVVNKVSVEVKQQEIVGLLGPNGAGKTTTFYMIVGMIKPDGGRVFLDEAEITKEPMYKRAEKGLGYLPQEASVFRRLSVEDNIMAVLQMKKMPNNERKEKVETLLEELNITHIRKSKGFQLSGGERRRCEIARALATDPKFILLDEPFAGVDPIAVKDIQEIIHELTKIGIGVLITDHNVRETLEICDRAYVMKNGGLLASGNAEDIKSDGSVRQHYLGENFSF